MTIKKYTKQSVFETAVRRLYEQNGTSYNEDTGCLYYNEETGNRCAVGLLFEDDDLMALHNFENNCASGALYQAELSDRFQFDINEEYEVNGINNTYLDHLQLTLHDVYDDVDNDEPFREFLVENAKEFAKEFNLDSSFIEELE